jgi:two-component system sensor histidine kinase KdpD
MARWGGYVVAIVSSTIAVGISFVLSSIADNTAPVVLLAAVALSGWYGGLGPALVATGLGFLALDYFFEIPPNTLEITDRRTVLDLLVFLLVAILLGSLNAQLRTARVRAEAARSEAEVAVQARDEALMVVSHDLRTPLTSIKAYLSALLDPHVRIAAARRQELLANTQAEVDRLIHFVTDALALNRLQAGVRPSPEWNALGEVASAVLDRCALALGERPVTFTISDTLPLLRFDAGLLDQALTNLLENVAAHTPPRTPVAITACLDGDLLRLEVSDGGPGIPPDARERIFNKFERLAREGVGAGLGLAIARAATEAQGGRLWVEDNPSGGARFVLVLPQSAVLPDASAEYLP